MPSRGQKLTAVTPILAIGVALVALAVGEPWWWLALALGWLVVTPLVAILFGDDGDDAVGEAIEQRIAESVSGDASEDGSALADREDALDVLRERYARGELDDVEFERQVERLLETESLAEAEALVTDEADLDRERA